MRLRFASSRRHLDKKMGNGKMPGLRNSALITLGTSECINGLMNCTLPNVRPSGSV